jgi:hypothetical protein
MYSTTSIATVVQVWGLELVHLRYAFYFLKLRSYFFFANTLHTEWVGGWIWGQKMYSLQLGLFAAFSFLTFNAESWRCTGWKREAPILWMDGWMDGRDAALYE